jgi:hypothetical protein
VDERANPAREAVPHEVGETVSALTASIVARTAHTVATKYVASQTSRSRLDTALRLTAITQRAAASASSDP